MDQDEKFNEVVAMMQRSELDPRAEENLRVFLFSLMKENGYFDDFINLLKNDAGLADNFFRCFDLKFKFFDHNGGTREEWDYILSKEKILIESLG